MELMKESIGENLICSDSLKLVLLSVCTIGLSLLVMLSSRISVTMSFRSGAGKSERGEGPDRKLRFFAIGDFGDATKLYYLNKISDIDLEECRIRSEKEFLLNVDKISSNDSVNSNNSYIEKDSQIQHELDNSSIEYSNIITVGDNFYFNGIANIWFRVIPWLVMNTFEREGVKDLQFYPVFGNHDCYEGHKNELLYGKYNPRWNFTTDFYLLKQELKDGSNKYFVNLMINSCKFLCAEKNNRACKYNDQEVEDQYSWIESQLQEHSEDAEVAWISVTLHHPVFTTTLLKTKFLQMIRKYKVDIVFAGHEHWAEYSNMAKDESLKMPNDKYGKVLFECEDNREVLIHKNREQTFKKGDHLHMFVIGNGGAKLRQFCPHKDQDGDVYFRNIQNHGFLDVEVTENKFVAHFWIIPNKIIYTVTIIK